MQVQIGIELLAAFRALNPLKIHSPYQRRRNRESTHLGGWNSALQSFPAERQK